MAMTGLVKDELSRVEVLKPCCRKAEVSTLLRFAGGLHIASGRIVVEAELDTGAAARRLRKDIAEVFGHASDLIVLAPGGLRKGNRYVVRVRKDGESLARQTGLVDSHGRPVRGLPRHVVSGSTCDCEAAWRGAFLAHGSLTEPGRSMSLEITCPGPEAALAMVGAARRLKIHAKAREVRGVDRVVIRDGDAISALLTRLGAHDSMLAWEDRRMRRRFASSKLASRLAVARTSRRIRRSSHASTESCAPSRVSMALIASPSLIAGLGWCTWYRSSRVTPRRLALATARCSTTGATGITGRILVARNTASRCPLMAWPRIRSLRPKPYISAVSNSVTPSSRARSTMS